MVIGPSKNCIKNRTMKSIKFILLAALLFLFSCGKEETVEASTDFNLDWKFSKGDIENAEAVDFDDISWEAIRLPHDWSVSESFTQENAGGATAFYLVELVGTERLLRCLKVLLIKLQELILMAFTMIRRFI